MIILGDKVELLFVENKENIIYNIKNGFNEVWHNPVTKDFINTLLNSNIKSVFIDKDGYMNKNF